MTPEQRSEWEARAARWLSRIASLLESKAPDSIVGHALGSFFHLSLAYVGDYVMRKLTAELIAQARQYAGLCPDCDGEIPEHRSRPAYCESCCARHAAEEFEYEVEHGDDEGDEGEDD